MKGRTYLIALIFAGFFAISFLTNILGAINPNVSDSFMLNGTMTGLLPFSFFIASALMSIPSGMFVQRFREKKSALVAWSLACSGALLFCLRPSFPIFLISLFLIGCGMAMLQVILYPLLRVTGGEKNFAFNSIVAQLVFGLASSISPMVYIYLDERVGHGNGFFLSALSVLTPDTMPWVSIYWVFAGINLFMFIVTFFSPYPEVERKDDERVGSWKLHRELLKQRLVILYFVGIFCYVGAEQGIANWIGEFLRKYHGSSVEEGARVVALFWTMMTVGCVAGLVLLKLLDSRLVLRVFTFAAMLLLVLTLFGNETMAVGGFMALGFCLSVMYGIIFSLALNSVTYAHGSFSGILCTGIAGGAVISLLIGKLADIIGLQWGMMFLLIPFCYVAGISFRARPLVSNVMPKNDPLGGQ